MIDETRRRPTVFWILFSLVLLFCFFVFPEPLPTEFTASPVWYKKITSNVSLPPAENAFPFSIDGISGFFSPDGIFYTFAPDAPKVLMGEKSWLSIPAGPQAEKTLVNIKGERMGVVPPDEIAFFSNKRLFSASSDGMRLKFYSIEGKPLWDYTFPCQVSAFDTNGSIAAAGMLDGSVEVIGENGKQLSAFLPGGSRLQVILGLDCSEKGDYIAMISGIDKQRLVILGKGDKDYRVIAHRYLESDFRTAVPVSILPDNRYVLYRHPAGIGVFSLDGKENAVLPVKAEAFTVHPGYKKNLYYIVTRNGKDVELLVFSPPDRLLGEARLPPDTSYYRFTDRSLFLGYESGLSRIDFKEE